MFATKKLSLLALVAIASTCLPVGHASQNLREPGRLRSEISRLCTVTNPGPASVGPGDSPPNRQRDSIIVKSKDGNGARGTPTDDSREESSDPTSHRNNAIVARPHAMGRNNAIDARAYAMGRNSGATSSGDKAKKEAEIGRKAKKTTADTVNKPINLIVCHLTLSSAELIDHKVKDLLKIFLSSTLRLGFQAIAWSV